MRVLIAEDQNEIRLLAAQQLENNGYRVVAVADGKKALQVLEHQAFDVVLLDEQMPELNGLQVLQAIRMRDKQRAVKTPVLALTGNNSEPDRERLLSAGFDGVLGKPFRLDTLDAIVRGFAEAAPSAANHGGGAGASQFTPEELLHRVAGGDEKLLRQVMRTFLLDLPKRLAAIDKAIHQKRADALASSAHALKGSVGIFGAEPARQLCAQLQELGRSNTLEDSDKLFAQLKEEIAKLEANLRRYAGQTGSHKAGTNTKTERSRPDATRKTP
jgi:two-component system sensor histidine kinase/response regulator